MDMKKPKVLIVEDERLIAFDLQMRLEIKGYDVLESVSSGKDAVKIALSQKVDLVLMDIKLQGKMDGIEAAQIICESKKVAIVILSGNSDLLASQRLRDINPDGVLKKPITDWELFESIENALK